MFLAFSGYIKKESIFFARGPGTCLLCGIWILHHPGELAVLVQGLELKSQTQTIAHNTTELLEGRTPGFFAALHLLHVHNPDTHIGCTIYSLGVLTLATICSLSLSLFL